MYSHKFRGVVLIVLGMCALATCDHAGQVRWPPPVAAIKPHTLPSPHGDRIDDYYWMRDAWPEPASVEVSRYVGDEMQYANDVLEHTRPMEEHLFTEMVNRLDRTAPEAPSEGPLDVGALSEGHRYFALGSQAVSPDQRAVAWTEDTLGDEQFTLRFRDLTTGRDLPEQIERVDEDVAWSSHGRTVLYVEQHPERRLGFRVRKHVLGTDPKDDPVVYEEKDQSFQVSVAGSASGRFLGVVAVGKTIGGTTVEQWMADANDPDLRFFVTVPREPGHEYALEDLGDRFVIWTNWQAKNFRIVEVPMAQVADRSAWRDVIAHRSDAVIDGVAVFTTHLAVSERSGGVGKVRIRRWSDGQEQVLDASEPTYVVSLGENDEKDARRLRWKHSSLTAPTEEFELDLATGERRLIKREPNLREFGANDYVSELLWIPARDGVRVPVSLVYRRGFQRNGRAPLLQYAYGSSGISVDPAFDVARLSLLDRGFVYAIAHVRGGGELGPQWHEAGKLLNKQNTFNDFVDVTRALVAQGYAAPDKVFAMGASAGGLLVGAAINQCPECYLGVIAEVPAVDMFTSLQDLSLPATAARFGEWGDPRQQAYYDYLQSYSPYDNVRPRPYPAVLVTAGLNDVRVPYFQPMKWAAKLRANSTSDAPVILLFNTQAGHFDLPWQYDDYRQAARFYAYLFDLLGVDLAREAECDEPEVSAVSYRECLIRD